MAPTITDLKWQPSQPNRVLVFVDGHPCVTVSLLTAGRLTVGDRIDAGLLAQWQADQDRRDAYQVALRCLGRRDHSRLEMRRKLKRHGFGPETIAAVLDTLTTQTYLDDRVFAANWVNQRVKNAPRSRRLLAQELRGKGIAADHIEAALLKVDDPQLAQACIRRHRRRWRRFQGPERRLKILAHLSNKGFSYDVSQAAVEACQDDQAD